MFKYCCQVYASVALLTSSYIHCRDTYSYNNPNIQPGEELNRRGFVMYAASPPSSLSRDQQMPAPLPPMSKLPRIGAGPYSAERARSSLNPATQHSNSNNNVDNAGGRNDFTSILNNDDLVFGGDIGATASSSSARPNPSFDYNYRTSTVNDNFSFQNTERNQEQQQPPPANYLNERMRQY